MTPESQASCFIPIAGKHSNRPILSLFIFLSILLGMIATTTAWADDEIDIDRASWSNDRDRLTVRGDKAPDNSTVTIRYGEKDDNGAVIGTTQADGDGEWEFRASNLNPVPCDVAARANGVDDDDKEVRRAPRNCSNDGGAVPTPTPSPTPSPTPTPTPGPTPTPTPTPVPTPTPPPQPAPDVSINSTGQNCGSADISGNNIACNNEPVPEQPFAGNNGGHAVIAINDLGMHCGDLDTRISSILPPFQVLLAQVIQKGVSPSILPPNQVDVYYSAVSNPGDPILGDNTVFRGLTADGSVYRTNFWDFPVPAGTYDAFYPAFNPFDPTVSLTPLSGPPFNITYDVGLPVPNVEHLYIGPDGAVNSGDEFLAAAIQDMPGIAAPYASANPLSNEPQRIEEHLGDKPFFVNFPFGYVANNVNWFEGAGIPFSAYDDFGRENAYPLVRVEARSQGGNTLASQDTVLPISGEASCKNCHADPLDPNFGASRTNGPTAALEAAGLPVVDSDQDPLLVAGNVPVDVAVEWATDINVLRLHDLRHGSNYPAFCDGSVAPCPLDPCTISATDPNGSDTCLTNQALVQQKPVVCQVCHYTPALDLAQLGPLAGEPGTVPNGRNQIAEQSNSRVMHNHHGQFTSLFPPMDPPVQDGNGGVSNQATRLAQLEETCYQCHPGTNVQCLRGAMFDGGMLCNDCHGDMQQVGADFTEGVSPQNPGDFKLGLGNFYEPDSGQPRVPWANEPGCGSCHTGDANDNLADMNGVITNLVDSMGNEDNIRLRQAFRTGDAKATPIVPTNTRFAENPIPASFNGFANPGAGTVSTNDAANGAANPKLYRVSTGHGGVFCEGCHGATHAEFDIEGPVTNDDVAAQQLQGHTGTIIECSTCHANAMDTRNTLGGPHGMHPVGENTDFADGGHADLADGDNCTVCHGPGGRGSNVGTVLSVAKVDRNFNGLEDGGFVAKGTPIGCTTCH
jgi:hypothetical protein